MDRERDKMIGGSWDGQTDRKQHSLKELSSSFYSTP